MKNLLVFASFVLLVVACKKDLKEQINEIPSGEVTDMSQLKVPTGFNFKSSDIVNAQITLLTNEDNPLKGLRVDVMTATPEEGGKILFTGSTNANGVLDANFELPTAVKEVVINSDYIGLPNNVIATVAGGKIISRIGGKNPERIVTHGENRIGSYPALGKNASKYSYRLGTFTSGLSGGRPNYLVTPNDVVSQTFLDDVNASLPERQPVPTFRPTYLNANVERNLILTEQCDVWITFVHEGAGYKNGLFYFVYNKNNKPTTIAQVDSFIAIFPNCSYSGSGGSLATGNKVKIGRWGADTAIGFAIAADGWNGTTVTSGNGFYTSIRSMNPETAADKKEHVVLLYDNPTQRFLIGFEDLRRDGSSDDDFNDVIIYASANPVEAIVKEDMLPTTPSVDADGDGVNDVYDEYPNDAQRAFNVYYPSSNTMASVAFEDLWPSKGDYDLNDVVVDFQYHAVTNGNNQMKDLNAKYKLRAAGGVFKNAFSVALPFTSSNVTVNSGSTIIGLEAASTAAILNVFSNSKALIATYNTLPNTSYVETDTLFARITLTTAATANVGTFNPFIFIDEPGKGRGYEVHLPGQLPTSLVNTSVLGTNADATNAASGVYYKTSTGLPFAIATPEKFDYPFEKVQIISAHKKFAEWVQSGGTTSSDWYKNLPNYRDASKIYVKP